MIINPQEHLNRKRKDKENKSAKNQNQGNKEIVLR